MILTENIESFTNGISPRYFLKPEVIENQKGQTLLDLWQVLKHWEHELKYCLQEYHALKKIAPFNNEHKNGNGSGNSFSCYRKAMNKQLPEYQKLLRSCRMELRMRSADASKKTVKKMEQLRELDQRLWMFKKEINKHKLGFFHDLGKDIPVSIF